MFHLQSAPGVKAPEPVVQQAIMPEPQPVANAPSATDAVLSPATNTVNPTPAASNDSLTKEKIDQRLEEVQGSQELDEAAKAELVKRYRAAQDWLRIASEANQKTASYQAAVKDAPRLLAEAKQILAQPVATTTVAVPLNATLTQIEQLASDADAKPYQEKAVKAALEKVSK